MTSLSSISLSKPVGTASGDRLCVLQVLHTLNVGGAEMLAARLARNLQDRFRFVFACLDELGSLGSELRDEGFTVEVLNRRSGIDLRCVQRLGRFARDERADLIHAHQYTPFFYCRAPGSFVRRPPVLFNEHGRFHPDLPSRKRMIFNRLFLRGIDRVVAVGEAVKQALIANEGIPASRIEVVYNGVNIANFSGDEQTRRRVRKELEIDGEVPVIIQVARLDYLKDHCTAIRAFEAVTREVPECRLLLVGEGPERPMIEAEITKRGLEKQVRLLGLRTDVRQLLSAADLFLLTSISEGIPVTFIEAMACHLPIVSTDVGGVKEVVEDGKTGLLAAASDDQKLADSIIRLVRDPSLRRSMGDCGRARAEQIFSEQEMHERYAALYGEMVRRPV